MEGGGRWVDEEGGRVGREQMGRLGQFIETEQMYSLIYSKKGDGRQYQLGHHSTFLERVNGSEK